MLVDRLATALAVAWHVAWLVGAAPAQAPADDAPREPTFARVLDAAGQPLAGAEVTFVGGVPHLAGAARATDTASATTDARGRAIARLRPGLCYVAWAVGPADGHGRRPASAVHGFFAAAAMFDLYCDEPVEPRVCRLSGLDAWAGSGPLRCVAMTGVPGIERELARDPEGRMTLPPGPFGVLEVRGADGAPVWHVPLDDELTLPPPRAVRVRVVDEQGAPIAGAPVVHRVGRLADWHVDGLRGVVEDRKRELGRTDADGRCMVTVPYAGDPLHEPGADLLLLVAAPGRAEVAGGVWNRALYVDDRKVAAIEADELSFTCTPAEPLVGVAAGAPPGTVAHLAAVCRLHLDRNGYLHDARVYTAPLDANGRFTFVGVPSPLHSTRLTLVPPPKADWRAPLFAPEPGRALPADVVATGGGGAPRALACGVLELVAQDANGGPARGGVAFFTAGDRRGVLLRDSMVRVPLDATGAARFDVAAGTWIAVVFTPGGWGARQVSVDGARTRLELQLQPQARCAVRLVDRAGGPIAGARVVSRGTTTRGTNDPVQTILQSLRTASRRQWSGLRTDADGGVVIPFVPIDGVEQRLELTWDGGTSEEFVLDAEQVRTVTEKR